MQMFRLSFVILTLAVFMTNVNLDSAERVTIVPAKFEIRKNFATCDEVEFVHKNVSDVMWCLMKCRNATNCTGVFSNSSIGHCVGCSQARPSNGNDSITNGTYFALIPRKKTKVCGPQWREFRGFCYFFAKGQSFQDGVNECQRQGADIAVIENEAENTFLRQQVTALDEGPYYATGVISDPDVSSGDWVKFNSTTHATFLPWHDGEPNNSNRKSRCAVLYQRYQYDWADEYCQTTTRSMHTICKKLL